MNNIYINIDELDTLINTLKHDNEVINGLVNNVNQNIYDIDNTKWNSPERKKFDEEFIPFLKSNEKSIKENLDKCVEKLNKDRNNYLSFQNK